VPVYLLSTDGLPDFKQLFSQAPKANHKDLEDRKEVSLGGLCGLCGSNSNLPDSSGILLDSRLNSFDFNNRAYGGDSTADQED
jgi:hypothetical protein